MATGIADGADNRFADEFNDALVSVGERLGLYNTLADVGPASGSDVASHVGIDRELIGHWLSHQADVGYLYLDREGRYSVSCPISESRS